MTSCLIARENMCAYIDNELSAEERISFEEHIESCSECKKELEEMMRIIEICNSLPQRELPAGFKAELHDKLLAVAKTKPFFFTRTFASIAAGALLIFLAGTFARFGLLSPKLSEKSAERADTTAAEEFAAQSAPEDSNGISLQFSEDVSQGNAAGDASHDITGYGSDSDADGSLETDRSAMAQNREETMASISNAETVSNKMSFLTITAEDPNSLAEKVKTLAAGNSGEEAATPLQFNDSGENRQMRAILQYKFPETQYESFVGDLYKTFGKDNVQRGAFVTEDLTDTLNNLIEKSETIDNRIKVLQNDSGKNADEIKKLKTEKDALDEQIESIRLDSDFITVTVYINKK